MVVARHEDELPLSEGLFLAFAEISLCEFKQREGRWPSIQEAPPFTTPRVGAGQHLSEISRKALRGMGLRVHPTHHRSQVARLGCGVQVEARE